jgi:hypothetical protein
MRHSTAIKPRDSLRIEPPCLPTIVSREATGYDDAAGRYEKQHTGGRSARQCAGGVRLAQRANREPSDSKAAGEKEQRIVRQGLECQSATAQRSSASNEFPNSTGAFSLG